MFTRTCVAAYCSDDVPGQCVRWVMDVHFFMIFQYWLFVLSYTGRFSLRGNNVKKRIDTIEKTQSTCWFWVLDNPAFAISYSVHNVCKKNQEKKTATKTREKKRTNIWCYIILRSYFWVETVEVYRSFCKHFLSKVEWKINIENYIMYNSSVEIAVVY